MDLYAMFLPIEDYQASLDLSFGVQKSEWLGFGANFSAMGSGSVSTNQNLVGLGLLYRSIWLNRILFKVEVGHILNYGYTTDWIYEYRYKPGFDLFYKIHIAPRFRSFVVGAAFVHAAKLEMEIWAYDGNASEPFNTGDTRFDEYLQVHLFLGISIDAFRRKRT